MMDALILLSRCSTGRSNYNFELKILHCLRPKFSNKKENNIKNIFVTDWLSFHG
jgi:hypothetical protein